MNPLKIYVPIVLIAIFAIWVGYRLFIKKDLLKNKAGLYTGLLFIGVWAVIFLLLK